jgi:UDP-glucose:(heptosyl)LPS alpha-1,3-glucosyltransferase
MKVGLVLERFDPSRGGREQWTFLFAQRLAARGHEVHVAAREFSAEARRLPLVLHAVVCARSAEAFPEAAAGVVEPLGLDIVHDMGSGWQCDVFQPHGGSQAALAERKLLLDPSWIRGLKRGVQRWLPRQRSFRRLAERQYADRGQILLALSESVADDFVRLHGVSRERIRVVYNGVDTDRFSPERCAPHREATRRALGVGPSERLALIVAHNFRLKGVPALLAAMASLAAEGLPVRLLVLGGKRLAPWRRRAARLGLAQTVRYVGPIGDPLPYYAAADLYVHPTIYDACSLVVLEAAACGLPIITSRSNGAAELFHNGVDARLLDDPANVGELAASIRALLGEPTRQRIGAAARQTVLEHSFERNVDRIIDVYQEVLRRRAR